jgi:hypothetical protein
MGLAFGFALALLLSSSASHAVRNMPAMTPQPLLLDPTFGQDAIIANYGDALDYDTNSSVTGSVPVGSPNLDNGNEEDWTVVHAFDDKPSRTNIPPSTVMPRETNDGGSSNWTNTSGTESESEPLSGNDVGEAP